MKYSNLISKMTFHNPKENQVVILHHAGYLIEKLILKEIPSTTIDYAAIIYVTPMLIARTLFRLWSTYRFNSIPTGSDTPRLAADDLYAVDAPPLRVCWFIKPALKDIIRQIKIQYVLACIDQTKAKLVLTFIDNSSFFQKLSRSDQKRTYFAIQNGTRTLFCVRDSLPSPPHPLSNISMTNLFCFGQRDIDLFVRHGHKIDNYLPCGSLVGGYYKSVVSVSGNNPKFDLCLISQWFEDLINEIIGDEFSARLHRRIIAGISKMNSFILQLLEETGLTLIIALRNEDDAAEVSFYKEIFGEKAEFAICDRNNFSAYRAVEQSRLAIAFTSTVLTEVFSCGQKVLWCNVPNDELFEMPEADICYFHGNDYRTFKERVFTLLNLPQEDYETRIHEKARYINNYNPENPPHEMIRSAVIKVLSNTD